MIGRAHVCREEEKKQEEFLSGKLRSYEENLTALSEYNELIPVAAEDHEPVSPYRRQSGFFLSVR